MKTSLTMDRRPRRGYAILMVLVMAAVSLLVLVGTIWRASNVSLLNERHNQFVTTLCAAEAATEKVVRLMQYDYSIDGDLQITDNLDHYREAVPTQQECPDWGDFQFTDAQGRVDRTYVQCISNRLYVPIGSQFYSVSGWRTVYRILSNARQTNGRFDLTTAVQQDVETDAIPIFQFAIFYNGLLEFTRSATLSVRGRVHANGDIYVGSSAPLSFNTTVTTTGRILKTNWAGISTSDQYGAIIYSGNPAYRTNVPALQLPMGTNHSAGAMHAIIDLPPSGEDVNSIVGKQRYFNKAGIVLLVSDSAVTATIKNSPADLYPVTLTSATNDAALATNFPFLTLTNEFTDQREASKVVKPTQIDIGLFDAWTRTNPFVTAKFPSGSGFWPNILYVADNRATTPSQLAAVRIMNGVRIPTNGNTGFTLATPNPLYVWGDYNNPSGIQNSTNTSQAQPASLVCDALTILSRDWNDSLSAGYYSSRAAVSTTVNAALIAGIVPSTGPGNTQFSGGVPNLPRLLENWAANNAVLTLNTSLVYLFNSVWATNQFRMAGDYYAAPVRNFNTDVKFLDLAGHPPGTPSLGMILRSQWANPPPKTITYAGF